MIRYFLYLSFTNSLLAAYANMSCLRTIAPTSAQGSVITFDTLDQINGFDVSQKKDRIIIKEDGIYFFTVTAQVGTIAREASGYIDIWFSVNGKPIANSGSRGTVRNSVETYPCVTSTIIALKAGDAIESYFAASGPQLGLLFLQRDIGSAIPSYNLEIFTIR